MSEIDPKKIPQHVAMIMDGNGRWAKQQGLHRLEGHRRGTETVDDIVTFAQGMGVKTITLFAFSQENWNRPADEVSGLMDLLAQFLVFKRPKLIQNKIRLRTIGEVNKLPENVRRELAISIEETAHFNQMDLVLALSYGSRQEILRAVEKVSKGEISPECFEEALDTREIPDPDLLIRTSGEYRISNFLLWQMAYTELYFTDTLWPDFTREEFLKAILEYQRRERRFGLTSDQIRDID